MQNRRRSSRISFSEILIGLVNLIRDLLIVVSVIGIFGFLHWAIESYLP